MKRIAANYLYINEKTLLKNGVVELDDNGIVQHFFSLDDQPTETSQTEFFNGILMPKDKKEVKIGEKTDFYLSDLTAISAQFSPSIAEEVIPPA